MQQAPFSGFAGRLTAECLPSRWSLRAAAGRAAINADGGAARPCGPWPRTTPRCACAIIGQAFTKPSVLGGHMRAAT